MNVAATYDALWLADALQQSAGGGTRTEIQTLAYLGCLMSIFDGHEPGWWNYGFTATRAGAPYARELAEAQDVSERAGLLRRAERVQRLTDRGRRELKLMGAWALNARRQRYLEAASAASLAMPLPAVADALSFEPGLRRALRVVRVRSLLDDAGVALLEQQFGDLLQVIHEHPGAGDDLMIPTVLWLAFLAQARPADRLAA